MKQCTQTFLKMLFLLMASVLLINVGHGQVLMTKTGLPYTQDFNSLSSTGASNPWSNDETISGWYSTTTNYSTENVVNNAMLRSYGTNAADRALGANSTSTTVRFGVRMKNTTGKQITSFRIYYRGEQWYRNTGTSALAKTLQFHYWIGTNLTNINPSSPTPSTFTTLDFVAPNQSAPTGPTDGNAAENFTNKSGTLNINVNDGQEIMFRWSKSVASGYGLGIDDLVIIPITAEPLVLCSQNSLSFADTDLGLSTTLSLQAECINLTGPVTLTMQSGATSAFSVAPTTLPQADGTTTLNVTFTPSSNITFNDVLIINGGGLEEPIHIALSGTGTSEGGDDPKLIVNPTSLTFPVTRKGFTSDVQNVSVAVDAINTHNIQYVLNDTENFILDASGFNSATGGTITIAFNPQTYATPKTAQLTISSGDLSHTVALTGMVATPTLANIPNTVYVANGSARLPITASNLGDVITITSSNPNFTPDKTSLPVTTTTDEVNISFTGTTDASTTITISTLAATPITRTVTVYGKSDVIAGWNFQTDVHTNANHGNTVNQGVLFSKSSNNTGLLGHDVQTASIFTNQWTYSVGTDKYWQTDAIRTIGFKDLTIQSKQGSQMQGPGQWKVQYKVGAGAWTDIPEASYNIHTSDLTLYGPFNLPVECNNKTEVYLRWLVAGEINPMGGIVDPNAISSISEVFLKGVEGEPISSYTVTIPANAQGSVTVMNGATPVTTGAILEEGTVLTLTATPNTGYQFNSWWDGNANPTRDFVLISNVTISATFSIVAQTHVVGHAQGDPDMQSSWFQIPLWSTFIGANSGYEPPPLPPYQRAIHKSQTIYTANKLQPMLGSRVTKIAYRVTTNPSGSLQATGTATIAQTAATNVTFAGSVPPYGDVNTCGFIDLASLPNKQSVTAQYTWQNYMMEFEFAEPFVYQGGNIVVELDKTPGTGVDFSGLSFGAGGTAYNNDPGDVSWRYVADNFVTFWHYDINSAEASKTASVRYPEITFTYFPFDNAHTITATASAGGTISPSGPTAVEAGANQTFTFHPNEGYEISNVMVNGTPNPGAANAGSYTFTNVMADQTIHVLFSRIKYTITASVIGSGGLIDPEGTVQVNHGDDETFYFFPTPPNSTVQVLIDGIPNLLAVNNGYHTFTNVTANHTIAVSFSITDFVITPSVISGNGTISPANPVGLNQGESQMFCFTPHISSKIEQVLVDNVPNPTAVIEGCYTFENVSTDHSIGVSFTLKTFTIAASVNGGNGTITPNGPTTVNYGTSQAYTIAANDDYRILKLLVDGAEQPAAVNEQQYYYSFSNITEDHTIEVFFYQTYIITATVNGDNGTITPEEAIVMAGTDQQFIITPALGYKISQVLVDGVNEPDAVNTGIYTFTNVSADHTIEASFVAVDNVLVVNAGSGLNGAIPISASYMDCAQHVQMIYPAEILQDIIGKKITKASYQTAIKEEAFGGATGTIKIMHTTATNLTDGFVDVSQATTVYTGPIAVLSNGLNFPFSNEFIYMGGNLLIDVSTNEGGIPNYLVTFYNVQTTGLSRFSYTFAGETVNQLHMASPKTFFEYVDGGITYHTVTIHQPVHGTIDVENKTQGGAVQSGASLASGTALEVSVTPDNNYVLEFILINDEIYQTSPAAFTIGDKDVEISAEIKTVGVNEHLLSGVTVYAQQNRVYIVNEKNVNLKSIQLIDLLGRSLYETSATGSTMFSVDVATGIYMVKLISEENKMVTGKVHLTK